MPLSVSIARGRLILPADVVLTRATDLAPVMRRQLRTRPNEVALSRPGARVSAQLLDADAAALVREFQHPSSVAEAVVRLAAARGLGPEPLLRRAYPLLRRLADLNLLVVEHSGHARPIAPQLARGDVVGLRRIVECVHTTVDTEVYRASSEDGAPCAIKIARHPADVRAARMLRHEAAVLRALHGRAGPRVYECGAHRGCAFLTVEWISGVRLNVHAEMLMGLPGERGDARRLTLAIRVATAYAQIHAAGVAHGDVHPGNVLVRPDGSVTMVDFGHATLRRRSGVVERGAVLDYADPEFARAHLNGRRAPRATAATDQYSLGVLAFRILTGQHYLDLHAGRAERLAQVARKRPRSFDHAGAAPWPAVERVLRRALEKDPRDRFPTAAAFADALSKCRPDAPRRVRMHATSLAHRVVELLDQVADGHWDTAEVGVRASISNGAAGVAHGLLRVAAARDDPRTAALATVWRHRAGVVGASRKAFALPELGEAQRHVHGSSVHHGRPGLAWVDAHAAMAAGVSPAVALRRFVAALARRPVWSDVTFGSAGMLVACASLARLPVHDLSVHARLHETGDRIAATLARVARTSRPTDRRLNLGIAHGIAGLAYAQLIWGVARGRAPSPAVERILHALTRKADWIGAGARWVWTAGAAHLPGSRKFMAGWCNGSAGFVHLWVLASAALGNRRYEDLAIAAGRHVWNEPGTAWDLCCGTGGGAYAMLALYRHTGDTVWLRRARSLGDRSVEAARRVIASGTLADRGGLMRGVLGVAVLDEELRNPQYARMPAFELAPNATAQMAVT